jgi:hypothetical protein
MNLLNKKIYIIIFFSCVLNVSITAQESVNNVSIHEDSTGSNFKGFAYSILPGVLIHGAGHYMSGDEETGWDLFKLEGISFATLLTSVVALSLGGNADEASGILVPLSMLSGGTFFVTWLFDIFGTTGLSNNLIVRNPYQVSNFNLSLIKQDNNQNSLYNLYNGNFQYGAKSYFIQLGAEFEESGDYQEYKLKAGYDVLDQDLYNFYIIPEAKYKYSAEGFSITQLGLQGEFDINMGCLSKTLKNQQFSFP